MNSTHLSLLLADRSMFRNMGSGFREKREHFDAGDLVLWLLLFVGVFVAIAIVARILNRHDKHRLYNSPRGLFRALCRSHELDRNSRRLLVQLARAKVVSPPTRLFLEPDFFDPAGLAPMSQVQLSAIFELRRKLFEVEQPQAAQ